jgi:hypothetical protein
MPTLCNKNLTPLQRRSIQMMGGAMLFTVLTNFSTPNLPNPLFDVLPALPRLIAQYQHSASFVVLLATLSVLPILLVVWIAGRYLTAEPDEFVRALVVRALLWGFAVTMAGDAVAGVLMNLYSRPFPLTILNADLFFVATGLSLRLILRSYR